MFTPKQAARPAAYPSRAAFAGATNYATGGMRARYRRVQGRSMVAACATAGLGKLATRKALAAAYAAHKAGAPLVWPGMR